MTKRITRAVMYLACVVLGAYLALTFWGWYAPVDEYVPLFGPPR
jgi:hypothetical protein